MTEPVATMDEGIYKRLVDHLPDLVFVLDREGKFISAHGDTNSVLGFTSEQLCRTTFLEISDRGSLDAPLTAADHPFLRQFAEPTCGSKTVTEFQMTARTRSGELRFLEMSGTGVYGPDGNLTSIYIVARDITFRKRLQARVEYLRQLNEQILSSMREGLLVLEIPELRVLSANRRFLSAAGLQDSQVVGITCAEIYSRFGRPTLFADMPRLLQRTLATGRVSFKEYLASDLTPSPIFLELTVQPIERSAGSKRQILVLIRDITRRKRLETDMRRRVRKLSSLSEVSEALQSTIHQLEDVLHAVLVGVTAGGGLGFNRAFLLLVNEAQAVLEGRIGVGPSDPQEANHIWTSLDRSNLSFSDLLKSHAESSDQDSSRITWIARNLKFPLSATDHLLIRCLTDNAVMNVVGGRVQGHDDIAMDPGLTTILETDSFVAVPLYTTQKAIGVLLADNFVTRRHVLFEDLEYLKILTHQASYAIDNARLYGELEQNVTELENANRSLQEQQKALIEAERLSTIGKMAASVAHEIRNPLVTIGGYARLLLRDHTQDDPNWEELNVIASEVARLEYIVTEVLGYARYAEPLLSRGDLNELVSSTLQTFNTDWTFDNVRVDVQLDPTLPPVAMDSNQIKQVLINILLNAVQSMPEGGRVLLTTHASGEKMELTVSDTGQGIPENLREKVFTPFFTTKSSGTGLGLNIASQIIAAHGGDIQFDSAPGRGTTFRITLPRAQEDKAS